MPASLRWLSLALFLWSFGSGLFQYLLPVFVRQLGGGAIALGMIFALTSATTAVAVIPGGWLADRFERRALIIAGWWMATPAALLYATARGWQQLFLPVVLVNATNVVLPAMQAYIAAAVPPDRLGTAFGLTQSAYAAGFILSPAIGGLVAERWGLRAVFWWSFGFWVASAAATRPLAPQRPMPSPSSHPQGGGLKVRSLGLLLALSVLVTFADNLAWPFAPAYLQDRSGADLASLGWLGSIAFAGGAILSPLCGRMADRWGYGPALAAAQALSAGATATFAFAPRSRVLSAAALFARGAIDGSRGLTQAMVGRETGHGSAGAAFARYNAAVSAAMAAAPYLGGWLYGANPALPFGASLPLMLLAAWMAIGFSWARRHQASH